MTDDNGNPRMRPMRHVESIGNWHLLFDSHVVGDKVVHQFVIEKVTNSISIFPGATLEEARKRLKELAK